MKKYVIPSVKLVIIIMAMLFLVVFCSSCTSKSGRDISLPATSAEKVVIIDRIYLPIGYSGDDPVYRYKVNRIDRGVVDFIDIDYLFDVNDTILYQF